MPSGSGSTVLGKRSRSSANSNSNSDGSAADATCSIATRSKRRAQFVILDDGENQNPFITPTKNNGADNEEQQPSRKRGKGVFTAPSKHGRPESRIPLASARQSHSPAKAPAKCSDKAKQAQATTPSTPRHRDALTGKVAVTPRHRLLVAGRPLTPRTPTTPRNGVPTIYHNARQLFVRGAAPAALFGRDAERQELDTFISSHIKARKSGCIYVSGPPGTGKSAFVHEVCHKIASGISVNTGYVNCMSTKTAAHLYRTLLEQFVDVGQVKEGEEMDALKALFMQRNTSYVITLDEVDHLLELDVDLLYSVFEWSLQKSSNLVLVGIANALDFTDRFLPRLKARGLKPNLLPFLPYTAPQISSVITSKLKSLTSDYVDIVPYIHPAAIMFLAKKVALQSGDLRKAFDICRRAIDSVEADTRDQHTKKVAEITPDPTPSPSKVALVENMNLSSPVVRSPPKRDTESALQASLSQLTAETAPRATIAHVARITASIFSNGTVQRLQKLNLQQKAVLCSLSAIEKGKRSSKLSNVFSTPSKIRNTAPTVKQLFETYTALCKRESILHALTNNEFRDVVGSLETLSLVNAVEGRMGSLDTAAGTPSRRGRAKFGGVAMEDRQVASAVDENELAASLVGPGSNILKGILQGDESC